MKGSNGKRNSSDAIGNTDAGNSGGTPYSIDADGNLTSVGTPGTADFRSADSDAGTGDTDDSSTGINNLFQSPDDAFGTRLGGSDPDASAGPRKRRGRPPGSGRKPGSAGIASKKVQTSLDGIEGILLSLHAMGAAALHIPELNLSEEEAAKLTAAVNRVAVLYDFGASEKTLAWVNLAVCMGGLYGTRLVAYNVRTKKEAKEGGKPVEVPKPSPIVFPNFT